MLPLRDANPALTTPFITWALIGVAAVVYLFVQPRAVDDEIRFFYEQASIPCEVTTNQPLSLTEIRDGTCQPGISNAAFPDKNVWWAVVVSMFLHGSLFHAASNLWILAIFGNNVEDAFGHFPFLGFYLVTGLAASAGHILTNSSSTIPVVGASGAIAAVMGSYLVLFPSARIVSIVLPLFFIPFRVPAWVFLGLWLFGQFALTGQATNVAYAAHIAGFIVGVLMTLLLRRRLRSRIESHTYRAWQGRGRWP